MFEDSKLTSITCKDLQEIYGTGWFAELEALDYMNLGEENPICDDQNYPLCGKWVYCDRSDEAIIFELPVNIYRKRSDEVDIGLLKVGLNI